MSQAIMAAIPRCNPDEALGPEDPRRVDLTPARGIAVQQRILKRLQAAGVGARHEHIALAGHRGSGKSTELMSVIAEAQRLGYLTLYATVTQATDPDEVSFGDLFLLMTRLLETHFRTDPKLRPLSDSAVNDVRNWFNDTVRFEENEIERSLELGLQAGLGGDVRAEAEAGLLGAKGKIESSLGKLLAALGVMRTSRNKRREEIRQAIEQYPQGLLDNLNLLLDDAHTAARSVYRAGILFVLDNVDRYEPEMVDKAVVRNAGLFNGINAHLIFTVPISLLYNPPGEVVSDRFSAETLPMAPVYKRQPRKPNDEVIDLLVEAIYRRVEPALFADAGLARDIARRSGGSPRDMLRLLQGALLDAGERIEAGNVERAAAESRNEMSRRLTLAQFDILARAHLSGRIDPDEDGRRLLFRRDVLEYNGERWVDAHPLLQETREFQEALARLKGGRRRKG